MNTYNSRQMDRGVNLSERKRMHVTGVSFRLLKIHIHTETSYASFFSVTKAYKKSHFLSPDHTEIFRASVWKVCLDAAKLLKFGGFRFLSYGGYKMS